ncbi:hypothetical protein NUSPORA_00928 [Nucleospora cyclopteri]
MLNDSNSTQFLLVADENNQIVYENEIMSSDTDILSFLLAYSSIESNEESYENLIVRKKRCVSGHKIILVITLTIFEYNKKEIEEFLINLEKKIREEVLKPVPTDWFDLTEVVENYKKHIIINNN